MPPQDEINMENLVTGVLLGALLRQQPPETLEGMIADLKEGPTGDPTIDSILGPKTVGAIKTLLRERDDY